jgi:hypothetical protein
LDQVFPEYATIFTKQGVFGKASKELLLAFSAPMFLLNSAKYWAKVSEEMFSKSIGALNASNNSLEA